MDKNVTLESENCIIYSEAALVKDWFEMDLNTYKRTYNKLIITLISGTGFNSETGL